MQNTVNLNLSDNALDMAYKALLEVPAKFSHGPLKEIEAEIVRIAAEAKSAEEKARAEATQKAIDDALAKAQADGSKTIKAFDSASDPHQAAE